jgi:hypothetical protein
MKPIIQNPDSPIVTVPWGREQELKDADLLSHAYITCQRADKGKCINTNLVRAFAKLQGRKIRAPATYKGAFHWSEFIADIDKWCMFIAPLSLPYARTIDSFDHDGKHFRAPVNCPMGPVRFVGFSTERRDTVDQRKIRRDRLEVRVEDGKLVPGARLRERQTPYVLAPA